MATVLGHGAYSFPDAARLTGLRQSRVREWFRGRVGRTSPVFLGDYEPVDGDYAVSFHDLIDVFVAGQLRDHGVSLQTLRRVYKQMGGDLNTPHPFCRKELLSDGKMVFMRGLDDEGQEELTEVLTRQRVFPQILLPFLKRIDYDSVTVLARRWRIADQVVVDPAICFGRPVVEAAGVATTILAAAYQANDRDADLVADWYNVHPGHVLAAVQFETSMAA
jgi:uncharacterized protein (DUF433 family)